MAVLGVASSIILARVFGVKVVGQFALASAPAGALWFLSSVKEQTALIKRLTALPERDPQVTGLWAAVFVFSMALTIVVALIAVGIAYFVFRGPIGRPDLFVPAVLSIVGYVFIVNVGWNLDGVFAAYVAGRELFWIRLHQTVMLLIAYGIAGAVKPDLYGLILATYLSPISSVLHRIVAVRPYMRLRVSWAYVRDGFRVLPEIIRFGLRMAPGTVAQGLSVQSSTWLLGLLSTVSAVGAFNRAQVLTMRFQDLTTRITEMLFPTLVARRASGDGPGFDRALIDTLRYSTVFMLAIGSVGGGGAFAIMDLFGPGFAAAAPAFAILLWLPVLSTMSVIQAHALYAVDRPGVTSWIAGGRLIVTIGLGYSLTKSVGLEGTALSLIGGAAFDVALKARTLQPYLTRPFHELWGHRQIVAPVAAYASGFIAARAVHASLPALAALPVTLAAGALVFAAVFVMLGGFNERDRARLSDMTRGRIRPARAS